MVEERVKCNTCENRILPITAQRHNGLCKPCFKLNRYSEIGLTQFGLAYDQLSSRPKLKTSRYLDDWLTIDGALPLYAVRHDGDWLYIYQNKTGVWPNLPDIEKVHGWCLNKIDNFRNSLLQTMARTPKESQDQQLLLNYASKLEAVVLQAVEFMKQQNKPLDYSGRV